MWLALAERNSILPGCRPVWFKLRRLTRITAINEGTGSALRSIKDQRARPLARAFGVCAGRRAERQALQLWARRSVSHFAHIMPDRGTPEYDWVLGKMGSLAAYGRAAPRMAGFPP